jgi:hypothetical protein
MISNQGSMFGVTPWYSSITIHSKMNTVSAMMSSGRYDDFTSGFVDADGSGTIPPISSRIICIR